MGCFQTTAIISSGTARANVSRQNARGGEGQGHLIEIGDRSPRFGQHERAGMPVCWLLRSSVLTSANLCLCKESEPSRSSHYDLPSLWPCLLTGQPCYHRSQRLHVLLDDTDIRDAVALPACQQLLANLVDRAQQQVWRLQDHLYWLLV